MCMDKAKVSKYFAALKDLLERNDLQDKPKQIWNMDETGLQLEHIVLLPNDVVFIKSMFT